MTLKSSATLDHVQISDVVASKGERLEHYSQSLGEPNRCKVPVLRAPYGHRNNVVYYYDQHGIVLNEHHATHLIQGIYFIFDPPNSRYETILPYSGELLVCGVPVHANMKFEEFGSQSKIGFKSHLGHAWYYDGDDISLQFEVKKAKGKRGLERGLILYLSIGFMGAHKMDQQCDLSSNLTSVLNPGLSIDDLGQ